MSSIKTLRHYVAEAVGKKVAIGHFNISNIEGLWAVFRAAQSLNVPRSEGDRDTEPTTANVPIIIGVSEGERDFVGVQQAVALVKSLRDEFDYPIFLNADHSYSFDRVKVAIDAGFDAVIFDGTKMTFEENVKETFKSVQYAKNCGRDVIVEGELGYIGQSSKVLDRIPDGVNLESLTTPDEAHEFVTATGVDMLAPAVGNIHGMMRSGVDPKLNIERIKAISQATRIPLVLHGGSGNSDSDFKSAISAGVAIIHINTELRVAYKKALQLSLEQNPDEVAPYKLLKASVEAMQVVVTAKLRVFNNL